MTNPDLARFYAKLCSDLVYAVPHADLAPHARNAAEHVDCADSPHFDADATRHGIAQVLRLAGALPV